MIRDTRRALPSVANIEACSVGWLRLVCPVVAFDADQFHPVGFCEQGYNLIRDSRSSFQAAHFN